MNIFNENIIDYIDNYETQICDIRLTWFNIYKV